MIDPRHGLDTRRRPQPPSTTWTKPVTCTKCKGTQWSIRNGNLTCRCGHIMTMADVSATNRDP